MKILSPASMLPWVIFKNQVFSGTHINSAKMVANNQAEIAAIDAVSLKLITKYDDFAKELKIIAWTKPTPSLPYIAYKDADQSKFFTAIQSALSNLKDDYRDNLNGLDYISKETYFSDL